MAQEEVRDLVAMRTVMKLIGEPITTSAQAKKEMLLWPEIDFDFEIASAIEATIEDDKIAYGSIEATTSASLAASAQYWAEIFAAGKDETDFNLEAEGFGFESFDGAVQSRLAEISDFVNEASDLAEFSIAEQIGFH